MREVSTAVIHRYHDERKKIQEVLAQKLRENMADFVGKSDHSDLILIASDGTKLPAHMCIIKQRAPGFFSKYIEPTLQSSRPNSASPQKRNASPQPKPRSSVTKPVVKIPDIDITGLKFLITSIYSEDEVLNGPEDAKKRAKRMDSSGTSGSLSGGDEKSGSRQGSPARKMIKSTESHDSSGTYNMDASIEDNADLPPDTDSSAKQESLDIADIEPEIQADAASAPLSSVPPMGTENAVGDSDRSGPGDLASQIFSHPGTGESPHETSLEDAKHQKTSFQEILQKSLTDESEPDLNQSPITAAQEQVLMTSFKEIAMESPPKEDVDFAGTVEHFELPDNVPSPDSFNGNSSLPQTTPESIDGDLPSQGGTFNFPNRSRSMQDQMMGRFIHFDDVGSFSETDTSSQALGPPPIVNPPAEKKIFPMFIEFENQKAVVPPRQLDSADPNATDEESDSFALNGVGGTFAQLRRKLSITSLRSVDSTDMLISPSHDGPANKEPFPPKDGEACSKLGKDLLDMLENQKDTDVTIVCDDGELKAHKCILSATCPYFAAMLSTESKASKLELKGFGKVLIHFLLTFLYGGITALPEEVTVWEVVSLADVLQLDDLRKVACLHIKGKYCHFFHKPCGACVSGVLDCLPSLQNYGLNELLEKCLQWQAKHFSRIWKTRTFTNITEDLQNVCFQAILTNLSPKNCIDVLLGCEKLQATLPKPATKAGASSYENVSAMVATLTETTIDFLSANFDHVITSESFLTQGRGLALNIGLLEDLLPGVVHSLTPDTGCRVLIRLHELLVFLNAKIREQNMTRELLEVEWNERFANLIRRLYELCDTHLIHCAAAVVKCDSWNLLNPSMQERIKETGLFIEIRQPRAPPPRLSSLSRTYRRSASAGVGPARTGVPMPLSRDRSASQKRRSAPIPESALAEADAENASKTADAGKQNSLKDKPIAEQKEPLQKTENKRADPVQTMQKMEKRTDPVQTVQKASPKPTKKASDASKSQTEKSGKQTMHKSPDMENLAENAVTGLLLKLAEQAVDTPVESGTVSSSSTVILSQDSEPTKSENQKADGAKKPTKIARSLTQTVEPKVLKPTAGAAATKGQKQQALPKNEASSVQEPSVKKASPRTEGARKNTPPSREATAGEQLKRQGSGGLKTQEKKPPSPQMKERVTGISKSPKTSRKTVSGSAPKNQNSQPVATGAKSGKIPQKQSKN